jgi:hypothetical protein
MSTPITQAHYDLRRQVLFSAPDDGAQLIADSEAAAVQDAMLREYGNLCATNESLAKERDQLRAEVATEKNLHAQTRTVVEELNTICADLRNAGGPPFIRSEAIRLLREDQATLRAEVERLTAQRENLLKPMRDQAIARAERAEASLHALRLVCGTTDADKFTSWVDRANARADRAEAELAAEKARLDWLEKQDGGFCHTKWGEYQNYWDPAFPTKLRAAIDAAMKEGAK